MKIEIFKNEIHDLFNFLRTILQKSGPWFHEPSIEVQSFRNIFGYSGYKIRHHNEEAEISLGFILGGTGFVLKRIFNHEIQKFDYFNIQGKPTFSSDKEALKPQIVDSFPMDLSCPFLDHFYNFLHHEYKLASDGRSSTPLVHQIELFLHSIYQSKKIKLPVKEGIEDSAIVNLFEEISRIEMDPVLRWEERQLIFEKKKTSIKNILQTKTRAHKLSQLNLSIQLARKRAQSFIKRFKSRPLNNIQGLSYKYSIGKVLWFFRTVKNNLGYSVALAVYGPFTYYFITMPMNPHAMQAVGKVRATYLEARKEIERFILPAANNSTSASKTEDHLINSNQVSDVIQTKVASPLRKDNLSLVILGSEITTNKNPSIFSIGENKTSSAAPSFLNMLTSADSYVIDEQTWPERMSNFKQMQIAYEENIEYASRMGRLEQLETQYNFPMQVEQTWRELERYNNLIFKTRTENPNLSAKMKQYLFNEVNRTQQLQLYVWDRLGRFILDQIYVMLDEDKEQQRNDYYVGRSFILMQEMTQTLTWRYEKLKKPKGYEKIEELAKFYQNSRKEFFNIAKNLQENSTLFKQNNIFDTNEFRSHMKRQWEILFLQNAKAEEAANMGLNMYIWSVRNTIWVLQSIYSTKIEELPLLVKRDSSGLLFTQEEMTIRSRASMNYETLFHNLVLEYVGIKEEINKRLFKDIESSQRQVVIENLKEFFVDREKLDGVMQLNAQNKQDPTQSAQTKSEDESKKASL